LGIAVIYRFRFPGIGSCHHIYSFNPDNDLEKEQEKQESKSIDRKDRGCKKSIP
jgi:hypothetical protein